MEKNSEDKYKERMIEVNRRLDEPKLKKKVDDFLRDMTKELNCEVEINFNVYPEAEEYEEYMDSDEFRIPTYTLPPMKLGDFVNHLTKEDFDYEVFIDPIYLKQGLNEVNDVLTTTVDRKIIIVPISHKNKIERNEKIKISD